MKANEPLQKSTRALSIDPEPSSPKLHRYSLTEVEEYSPLVRRLFSEVDACHQGLEESRVLRIRNGVPNVHSVEVPLFQHTHGQSATRVLHDPFFEFRESCLPRLDRPIQHRPNSPSPFDVAELNAAELDEGRSSSRAERLMRKISIKDDESVIDTALLRHRRTTHSPNHPRRRVVRYFNAVNTFSNIKRHEQLEKSGSNHHERASYPETPGEIYRHRNFKAARDRYRRLGKDSQNMETTKKYEETRSEYTNSIIDSSPSLSNFKTVDSGTGILDPTMDNTDARRDGK